MSTDAILKPSDFDTLVGTELPLADAAIALTLESVTPLRPHALREEPFALVLRLPAGWRGDQGLYALAHPRLGRVEVFCTPIEPAGGCARLEAVFN
jgi:hypothetical protein